MAGMPTTVSFTLLDKCLITDAKEKARLDIHTAIRDACTQGDVKSVRKLLLSIRKDAELIINMAPSGANTLLFTPVKWAIKK
nr:unnamed protein product [Callosobruchus analis]